MSELLAINALVCGLWMPVAKRSENGIALLKKVKKQGGKNNQKRESSLVKA